MKRVLLTGATGFIGANCVPLLLDAGYEVHAVTPEGVEASDERVHWHRADLLDVAATSALLEDVRPSHLLHLAWFVAPGEYWRSTENLRWLHAGLDLARGFAEVGGKRSVMAGTCAEYEASSVPLVEGVTPLRPTTLYGACKTALHLASASYFTEQGVSSAWAHIFYLYGPREYPNRLVPAVVRALMAGEIFECVHPDDVRDFLYVEDVAAAFVALLDSGVEGDVNIASGEPLRIGALVAEIANEVGRPELISCAAGSARPAITVGDPARLSKEVGFCPRRSRREGVATTVAWWKLQSANRARGDGAEIT